MIKVFNSAYTGITGKFQDPKWLPLDEVTVVTIKLDLYGKPYMLFEHADYPGGALQAQYRNDTWECDLD